MDKIIRDRMNMSKRNYWDDCETGGPNNSEQKWIEYYSVH
jgi:hypothetical protein